MILKGKARKLADGHKTRDELRDELFEILAGLDGVEVRRGPLPTQGRVSFSRANEGEDGRALFIPGRADE